MKNKLIWFTSLIKGLFLSSCLLSQIDWSSRRIAMTLFADEVEDELDPFRELTIDELSNGEWNRDARKRSIIFILFFLDIYWSNFKNENVKKKI